MEAIDHLKEEMQFERSNIDSQLHQLERAIQQADVCRKNISKSVTAIHSFEKALRILEDDREIVPSP